MRPHLTLAGEFLRAHPPDAADALSELSPQDAARVLSAMPGGDAAAVLGLMPPESSGRCVSTMSPELAASLLARLPPHVGASLLRSSGARTQDAVLERMPPYRRSRVEAQLRYPPLSVGRSMDSVFPAIRSHATLGQLRSSFRDRGAIDPPHVYVVDGSSALVGVVDQGGLDWPDDTPIRNVMASPVDSLYAFAPLDSIREHPAWTKHDRLPVTSTGNALVGTLRHRDLRQPRTRAGAGNPAMPDILLTIGEVYWESLWSAIDGFASRGAPGQDRARGDAR